MLTLPCPKCVRGGFGTHPAGCTTEMRFWHRIARIGACWEWQGPIQSQGYGVIRVPNGTRQGKLVYAHRFAYEGAFGDIADGLEILHTCDNRKCVRPAHLFVGTHADNMRDAANKGRLVPRRKGDVTPATVAARRCRGTRSA